jgi:hypothetical protein
MGFLLKRFAEWREKKRREWEEFERRVRQLDAERQNEINPLPFEEARQRAEALLADATEFECDLASQAAEPRLEPLAPALRDFFERYDGVSGPFGPWMARFLIKPSLTTLELIEIGSTGDADVPLAVRPNEETGYELVLEAQDYEDETDLLGVTSFTTIYHCLIYYHRKKSLLYAQKW